MGAKGHHDQLVNQDEPCEAFRNNSHISGLVIETQVCSATSKETSGVLNGSPWHSVPLIFVEATPPCRIPSSNENSYHGAPSGVPFLSADLAGCLSEPVLMNILRYKPPLKC